MMGVQPSEARSLTWWEYQAMLWTWNDRHSTEEEPVEAPEAAFVERRQQRLADRGIARTIH
jgi:hypothetical protein